MVFLQVELLDGKFKLDLLAELLQQATLVVEDIKVQQLTQLPKQVAYFLIR